MSRAFDFNTAARAIPHATPQETERRLDALRAELARRARDIVRDIFPAATVSGHQARIGDATGEPGESMCIELDGDRAGLWHDHATGEGGDLITLWCMGEGLDTKGPGFMLAVSDLEIHLGLATSARPASFGKVARVAAERAQAPRATAAVKVDETVYVYTSADGRSVLAQVVRRDMSDGSKTFLQRNAAGEYKAPEVRPLYNLPGIVGAPSVVIVEGEKCADTLKGLGVAASTLMAGAKAPLSKSDLEPLRGKQVVLWPDNDDAGREFMTLVLAPQLRVMGCDVRLVAIPGGVRPKWDAADAQETGHDPLALIAAAVAQPLALVEPGALQLVADRTLRLRDIDDLLATPPPRWLIDRILPEHSFAAMIGAPASLKSFLALDWGLCIAHGRPWLGRVEVRAGPVLLIAGEGQAGVTNRIAGWRQAKDETRRVPFKVLPEGVAMPSGQLDELLFAISRDMPEPPVLIILDTLARSFGGGDENSTTDMGAFVRACDRLRAETGACVLVVHHTGKDTEKGARGSSALLGALDCAISLRRARAALTVTNSKQKDAEEFAPVALTYASVNVAGRGDGATTLVLMPDDSIIAANEDGEPGPTGPSPNERRVLDKLTEAAEAGHPGLGFTGIQVATAINKGTLSPLLSKMVDKGLLQVEQDGHRRVWTCV